MLGERTKRWMIRGGCAALSALMVLVSLDLLFPPPIERGRIVSTVVTDKDGRPLRAFPVAQGRWRLDAGDVEIDPYFIEALIAIEDQRFYQHWGVDPLAVTRAVVDAARQGRVRSGASTLTMQTARLLEPRPRTLGSKIIEVLRALQIERRLSKDEILNLYLTLTPYGGNLEGVRAASWAWFGREPQALTPDQIALLIALPQAPEARRPDRRGAAAMAAREKILNRMNVAGLISKDRARDAADEAIPSQRAAFPSDAWHVAQALRKDNPQAEVTSTINFTMQEAAQNALRTFAKDAGDGVQASALIVEVKGRAVRAAIGSAGRDRQGGWIDLTNRARSPGSTLKPFIYAMAFDDGVLAPDTVIQDLPARFASYRPENFDRTFRGEVTIAQALQHSLNVPAVRALDRVGTNRFVSAIRFAGGNPVLPQGKDVDVGLAVALGGLGLSVRDLAVMYAALADEGQALPLSWTPEQARLREEEIGHAFISRESAQDIVEILAGSPAPIGRMPARLTKAAPVIAYKTGTSYGFRDAWAAGMSGGYVVVVWTGRPNGAPRPGVTGRKAALPLVYELFDAISTADPNFTRDQQITRPSDTPKALARFTAKAQAPQILFPPERAEIWADDRARGFMLAARGEGPLTWYSNGVAVPLDAGGAPYWVPGGPGFYALSVVDHAGRTTRTRVRVRTPD